jgi:hypothetical protein
MPALWSQLAKYQAFTCWVLSDAAAAVRVCICMCVFYCLPVFTYATPAKRRAMWWIYVLGALLFYFILIASTPYKYEERGQVHKHTLSTGALSANKQTKNACKLKRLGNFVAHAYYLHNGSVDNFPAPHT